MPAPSCLRWAGALPRPPECFLIKVAYRLRNWGFVFKGLLFVFVIVLMTVPSVLGDECATKMRVPSDGVSRALLAPQVIEAVLQEKIQSSNSVYEAVFRVARVYKRYRGPGRLKKHRTVSLPFRKPVIGTTASGSDPSNGCLVTADLQKNRKYFLFLSSATNSHEPLVNVAPPIPSTKRTKKRIKQVVCAGCAKAPSVGRLRVDSVVRGHTANLTCTFDGSPLPVVTWLKGGRIIDPNKKRNFRINTRRLRSRLRNRRPRRKRRRKRAERRMNDTEAANLQRKRKSRRKKEMRSRRQSVQLISTLTIVASRKIDEGEYSCVGKSVLGEASAKDVLKVVAPIDPGIVYPCPYDSFCLNGGTCMFFKHFGEFVCQCAEGYKGQRCQEKEVFPTISDPSCRGSKSYLSPSRGLRCPRNQPLWEFVQQSLAARKQKVTPWTKHHHLTWTPSYISGLPWDKYMGRLPTMTHSSTYKYSRNNEPFKFLQNFTFTPYESGHRRKGQLAPQQGGDHFGSLFDSEISSEMAFNSSEYADPQLSNGQLHSHNTEGQITLHDLRDPPQIAYNKKLSKDGASVYDDKSKNFTNWLKNLGFSQQFHHKSKDTAYPNKTEEIASNSSSSKVRHRHQRQKQTKEHNNNTDEWISRNSLPSIKPTSRRTYIYPTSISPSFYAGSSQNYSSNFSETNVER